MDKEKGVLNDISEIDAVGHRVAHGGERFRQSSRVDEDAIAYLESIVPINPLHGPAAIKGMKAFDIPDETIIEKVIGIFGVSKEYVLDLLSPEKA